MTSPARLASLVFPLSDRSRSFYSIIGISSCFDVMPRAYFLVPSRHDRFAAKPVLDHMAGQISTPHRWQWFTSRVRVLCKPAMTRIGICLLTELFPVDQCKALSTAATTYLRLIASDDPCTRVHACASCAHTCIHTHIDASDEFSHPNQWRDTIKVVVSFGQPISLLVHMAFHVVSCVHMMYVYPVLCSSEKTTSSSRNFCATCTHGWQCLTWIYSTLQELHVQSQSCFCIGFCCMDLHLPWCCS